MDRNHLERLLREPNNLFGPPRGRGYDYWRSGTIAKALVLTWLSAFVFFEFLQAPPMSGRVFWGLWAAPFALGWGLLWPTNVAGLLTSFLVWFGILRSATWKWHRKGRWPFGALVGGLGWVLGLARLFWLG